MTISVTVNSGLEDHFWIFPKVVFLRGSLCVLNERRSNPGVANNIMVTHLCILMLSFMALWIAFLRRKFIINKRNNVFPPGNSTFPYTIWGLMGCSLHGPVNAMRPRLTIGIGCQLASDVWRLNKPTFPVLNQGSNSGSHDGVLGWGRVGLRLLLRIPRKRYQYPSVHG